MKGRASLRVGTLSLKPCPECGRLVAVSSPYSTTRVRAHHNFSYPPDRPWCGQRAAVEQARAR
jgi:hypothetical protein